MSNLILFNKPFRVLSQFTTESDKRTLAEFGLPKGFYAAGRLDWDSEGLLILTNNGKLQAHISQPKHKVKKTYWVQVEGSPNQQAIAQLEKGLVLKDGPTQPAKAKLISPPQLWERHPPIRERKHIPTSWLALSIIEGRNRQVRRMTAAVGHPTLRLVRVQIGNWHLAELQPGQWTTIKSHEQKSLIVHF